MTKFRLRMMAGALALTIGGIVVCAGDKPKVLPAGKVNDSVLQYEPCCAMPVQAVSPCAAQCPVPCEAPTPCPPVESQPIMPVVAEPKPFDPPAIPTVPEIAPSPGLVQQAAMPVVAASPYKLRMEMVNGITNMELIRGNEVALRVQCEKADVQMPAGGIQATGKVSVAAPGLDVRCNRLRIGWHDGAIVMDGQVRILCQNGQQRTEMSAESVNCRLNTAGGGLQFTSHETIKPIE